MKRKKKRKKTERKLENGKKTRKKRKEEDGSDTVPATPFAKPREIVFEIAGARD